VEPVRRVAQLMAGVLAAGLVLAGCTVTGTVYAQHEDRQTVPVGLAPLVVVDTFNGRITVTAGAEDSVDVRVTSRGSGSDQAEAEQDLAKVAVAITSTADRVTITARRTDQPVSLGDSGADVEVTVPPRSSLQLRTSNGRIEAANTSGSILARASNGAITTRGGRDLDLDTTNGPVSVNLAQGKLKIRTSNGALDIIAADDAQVTAETSNAILTFSGSLAPGSNSFATSNANLALTFPGDAAFTIDGVTSNGRVQTDFPRLEVSDTEIRGTAGISSVTVIRATTSNGDLSVMHQRP
jgi:hypothetical protein